MSAVKSYGSFVGFCVILNYTVGSGFLGVPYVFYHTGLVAGLATLAIVSAAVALPAMWTLETMARAQALETAANQPSLQTSYQSFRVRSDRRFEIAELCRTFLGPFAGNLYLVALLIYQFLSQWMAGPTAAAAWACKIPFDSIRFQQCRQNDFLDVYQPTNDGCWNSYALCVLLFAVVVVPLSCLELKEQAVVQVVMALVRFAIIGSMIVYSIVVEVRSPETSCGQNVTSASWTGLQWNGFLAALPVFVFAQMLHVGIPTLSEPIRNKSKLARIFWSVFGCTTIIYGLLGVAVAIRFKSDVNEVCSLNWDCLTRRGHSVAVRVYSYAVVLFPSIDACTAYPVTIIVMANMVDHLLTGDVRVTSSRWQRTTSRIVCAVAPLIGACFVSNMLVLDKISGFPAFLAVWVFPALLQWRSSVKCRNVLGTNRTIYSSWYSNNRIVFGVSALGIIVILATCVGYFLPGSLN